MLIPRLRAASRHFRSGTRALFTNLDRDEPTCPHTAGVHAAVASLAASKELPSLLESTRALRAALTAAAAEDAGDSFEDAEPLFLNLDERTARLAQVYSDICSDASASGAAADAGENDDDDERSIDDLAAESPIPPRSLTFGTTPFETVGRCPPP